MNGPRTSLRVRVVPGASRAGVVGPYGDGWKLRVTAAPEGGRANAAVVELLARTLGVPRRDVELTSGNASRDKVVTLDGLAPETIAERLADAAEEGR